MPPKNTQPCELLPQLYTLDEETDIEAEGEEWPKANPYIKPTTGDTFTAEVKIDPAVAEAFTAFGAACKQTADALFKLTRAAVDCVVAIYRGIDIAQLLKAAKVQAALKEAPPRVRHLAQHGKKHRTRKKNINRALREHQRRQKHDRT